MQRPENVSTAARRSVRRKERSIPHKRRYASRLNSFRIGPKGERRSVPDALSLMSTVPGLTATELNYPQHVSLADDGAITQSRALGLDVTALNMRYDPPTFAQGAFTHPDSSVREAAVRLTIDAVDLAARHGIPHVIVWPGPDGVDLPFQAGYDELWSHQVAGLRASARRNPSVQVSIEYKPSDPRRVSLVANMGEALLCAADTGESNVGVTLDLCHGLMAGELPAKAAALALRRGKLFGLHLNDGYGPADDGLMVGAVHGEQLRELLWTLRVHGWDGTVYFDTFPTNLDPIAEAAMNIAAIDRIEHDLDGLDADALRAAQSAQDPILVRQSLLRSTSPDAV